MNQAIFYMLSTFFFLNRLVLNEFLMTRVEQLTLHDFSIGEASGLVKSGVFFTRRLFLTLLFSKF